MKLGNIVTVTDINSNFFKFQGEVVKIKKDDDSRKLIGVNFEKQYSFIWGYHYNHKNVVYFKEDNLRVEKDYSPEHKANSLFSKRMWHTLYTLKNSFDPQKLCMYENCPNKREKRIMLNAWGVVQESDVCFEHAEDYHGKCVDLFPYRQDGL